MHGRHRNPGNGYRSNAMGVGGVATGSRDSPEGSTRGRGFNNYEYRNYNRGGYGRGGRRQFQPPQVPPPRKGDIFMEAGKLAAEYLVCKGLLPPNALSSKWQSGSLKNQGGDFQSVRSQEGDVGQINTRSGNAGADTVPGRRKYSDEYNSMSSRNSTGGRKRSGSFKNYGSEWNRELGRSGSWSERSSPDMVGDPELQSYNRNAETSKSDIESALKRNKSNASENTEMILSSEAVVGPTEESGARELGEVKNETTNDDIKEQSFKEDIASEPSLNEHNQAADKPINLELLTLFRFGRIPTKTRSSLMTKNEAADHESVTEFPEDVPVDGSSNLSLNSENVVCDVKKEPTIEEDQSLVPFMVRGEKRALDDDKNWAGTKKPRESDARLGLSIVTETPEEPVTSNFEDRRDQKRSMSMSLFEEKLFPCSLKSFDLNLMEASEANENHHGTKPSHGFSSTTENGKQSMPIDIDLSMSNKGNASDKYGKHIEVIDLEDDYVPGENNFNGSEKRTEIEFSGLDGFPNNPDNTGEIADVQEGYGSMIMELLGNDAPNCSSAPPEINSLDVDDDMSLRNGEGCLGDDDSIYNTLGEIPTSFSRVWEQPNQEFGKPF